MANFSPQTKAFSLQGIMKDYKLSALLSDALNSNVGSTQRKRASAALKALQKMKQNSEYKSRTPQILDGKGGAGAPLPNPYIPTVTNQFSLDPLTGNVPGAAPLDFNTLQQSIQTLYPGAQMQMISSGWTGSLPGSTVGQLGAAIPGTAPKPELTPLNTGPKSVFDLLNSSKINFDFKLPTTPTSRYVLAPDSASGEPQILNTLTNQTEPRFEIRGRTTYDKYLNQKPLTAIEKLGVPTPRQVAPEIQKRIDRATSIIQPSATAPTKPVDIQSILSQYPKEFTDYVNQVSGTAKFNLDQNSIKQMYEQWQDMTGQRGIQPFQTPTVVQPMMEEPEPVAQEITNWAQNWYGNLEAEDQERFQTLYSAVNSGLGPDAFAYMVMSDRDELHRLFPDVPLDQLPMGASLTRQIVDIKKRTKEELGLNQVETKLMEIQSRGYTLLPTLTDYIGGRDEYLHKIDGMINDTKGKMVNMDLSDPTLSKSMNDYMNYLYVLKGRQNKRYGDWLNQSIDAHNAEATRINDQYTSLVGRYNDEVAGQTAIAQEDFRVWQGMLTGLYNSIDGMERKELETETLRAQLDATYLKMTLDSIGGKDGFLDQSYLEGKDKYFQIIGGVKQSAVGPIGADGKPTDIYSERAKDIDAMMDQAETAGLDPQGVIYWLSNSYIPSYVKAAAGSGNLTESFDFYADLIKIYAEKSKRPTAVQEAKTLASVLLDSAGSGIQQYLSGEDVKNSVQSVLADLVDTTITGRLRYNSPESRDKFLENNTGELPDDILNKLFDVYESNVLRGGANPLDLFNVEGPVDDLVNNLTKDISNSLRTKLYFGS